MLTKTSKMHMNYAHAPTIFLGKKVCSSTEYRFFAHNSVYISTLVPVLFPYFFLAPYTCTVRTLTHSLKVQKCTALTC